MKIEFLHHYHARARGSLRDRLVAYLPRYARAAARLAPLMNLRDTRARARGAVGEARWDFAARRSLPRWRARLVSRHEHEARRSPRRRRTAKSCCSSTPSTRTSSRRTCAPRCACWRPRGYRVHVAAPADGGRPLCCGRTYLAAGMVDEARAEARAHARRRWRRTSRAACRSSGSSRRACSALRDEVPHAAAGRRQRRARGARRSCSRNSSCASAGPGACSCRCASRLRTRAGARPLPPEGVRRDAERRSRR